MLRRPRKARNAEDSSSSDSSSRALAVGTIHEICLSELSVRTGSAREAVKAATLP